MRRRWWALLLPLLGAGMAVAAGLIGLRLAGQVVDSGCAPAPGEWLTLVQRLLRHYRPPCSSFFWLPDPGGEYHILVRLNNFGLHAPPLTLDKPSDVFRVLLVGDSFPQGLQVEIEQGFPYRLGERLSQASGRRVEVINLSVDAYGTDRELLLYALLGWRFQPDVVLLSVYAGNDVLDNAVDLEERRYGYRLDRPFFTLRGGLTLHNSPIFDPALYSAPAFGWLTGMQARQAPPPPPNPPLRPAVTRAEPYEIEYPVELGVYLPPDAHWAAAWALTERLLLTFRDLVHSQGTRLAAVIIPDRRAVHVEDWAATLAQYGGRLPGLRASDPLAPAARLERFLGENGVPALNLTWALKAAANRGERLYYAGDGHFNPRGHAVAADRLALWLRELRLVP